MMMSCRHESILGRAADLQRAKLEGSGLGIFFDTIVISGEVGFGKPDPRIFKLALARLDTKPEAAVMVGNSLKSDMSPAMEIGMMAIWVNREGKDGDKSIVPNAEVADLTKLKDIFEQDLARDGLKPRP
jgi:FMN phosphatase YigB (HAD superfamily)